MGRHSGEVPRLGKVLIVFNPPKDRVLEALEEESRKALEWLARADPNDWPETVKLAHKALEEE